MISRKYIVLIVILALGTGLAAGFFISEYNFSNKNKSFSEKIKEKPIPAKSKETIEINVDTILTDVDLEQSSALPNAEPEVENPLPDKMYSDEDDAETSGEENMSDTIEVFINDSIPEFEDEEFFTSESIDGNEEIVIKREVMLESRNVNVRIPEQINLEDSVNALLEEKLSITNEKIPKTIVVEFWQSPVNFKGYKFNRKKLVLYGINTDSTVSIINHLKLFYLQIDTNIYNLFETNSYSSFSPTKDAAVKQLLLREN